ncbi:redoxin domain-containing protein [SAR202 cluster bacterium AC-647-N09_OGT_505m]|nr:redoxin domain-containing protein [SAR202 cluster bacterium AC-647-N09_OGT_505m]
MLIVAAFFSLLGWALVHTGGAPVGMGVNKVYGEVSIQKKPAPNFTLRLLDGSSITLADLKGTVVLIDFWASWCPPCRDEASALAQVYTEYQGLGVEFIGISIWDRLGDAEDYVQHFEITYPTGLDSEGTILVDYAVRGIPEKFFIDANGQMHAKYIGPSDVDSLRESLNQMLAGRN